MREQTWADSELANKEKIESMCTEAVYQVLLCLYLYCLYWVASKQVHPNACCSVQGGSDDRAERLQACSCMSELAYEHETNSLAIASHPTALADLTALLDPKFRNNQVWERHN